MNKPCDSRDRQIVDALIAQMEHAASRGEISAIFSDATAAGQIEKCDPILYRCGSYFIYDVLQAAARQWVPVLQSLNEKNVTLFPELIRAVSYSDYCTVFLRIEGMNGQDLLPLEAVRADLSLSCRQSAYRELERLCQAALYIPWPARGAWGWCVTADGHRIVVPVRGNVVRVIDDPGETPAILQAYRDYLLLTP